MSDAYGREAALTLRTGGCAHDGGTRPAKLRGGTRFYCRRCGGMLPTRSGFMPAKPSAKPKRKTEASPVQVVGSFVSRFLEATLAAERLLRLPTPEPDDATSPA